MPDFSTLSLHLNVLLFAVATTVILVAGWKLVAVADRIADVSGLGEAITGAVFLGATTSLSGSITSVTAALAGHADLAVGNALGGIAVQTAFLALADFAYKQANLEHAAASVPNIMHGTLVVALLAWILLAMHGPEVSVGGVNPASLLLVIGWFYGMHMVSQAHTHPMWRPRSTSETQDDEPSQPTAKSALRPLLVRFVLLAVPVAIAGWIIARSGIALASQTGLTETAVGGVLTAVSTSLPELVTAIAAVRQGALTLAVGDIVGGNAFDTLFVAVSDVAYRDGSIYHAIGNSTKFLGSLALLQTGVLLMGMVRRERHGIANIGFESVFVFVIYAAGVATVFSQ